MEPELWGWKLDMHQGFKRCPHHCRRLEYVVEQISCPCLFSTGLVLHLVCSLVMQQLERFAALTAKRVNRACLFSTVF